MATVWCRALLAALILLTSGCASARLPAPEALTWSGCGDDFECARLRVPLDHAQPAGEQIEISVIRLPATGDRIGSLLINPGGPGGSGIDYARAAPAMLSQDIRARFDIVGFDPRGVGASTPIKCLTDDQLSAFIALDSTPDTQPEQSALEQASKDFAKACQASSAKLLPHVSTTNAARDMDLLRAALGDEKLTYLGKSYGTLLGATYAHLFPGKVRALVLDGAMNPAITRQRLNLDQAKGFETAFRAYAKDCLTSRSCPLTSKTPEHALAEMSDLLRRTDKDPLTSETGRPVTEALATLGALTPLYDRNTWPALSESLAEAQKGNGTLLLSSADQLVGRADDGTYSNQTESGMAITCADTPTPPGTSALAQAATTAAKAAPVFGSYVMWSILPCAFWPPAPEPPATLRAPGAAPILVLGTRRDPATPYHWSQSLADQLESGTLLTYEGDGHTAYGSGSTCIDTHVDHYLITRTTPADGTRC
ncbi:alpha/beta hydrolase [Nonomuraea sp. NPDC059007]|uniref:alpha/beta hydrolase n=1 Tax=Nonomuraea sp. NPDC059007 TaxID=3346692 RepID=UPI00368360DB